MSSEHLQRLQAFLNPGDCVERRIHLWDLSEHQPATIHKELKHKHFRDSLEGDGWRVRTSFKIEWPLFGA